MLLSACFWVELLMCFFSESQRFLLGWKHSGVLLHTWSLPQRKCCCCMHWKPEVVDWSDGLSKYVFISVTKRLCFWSYILTWYLKMYSRGGTETLFRKSCHTEISSLGYEVPLIHSISIIRRMKSWFPVHFSIWLHLFIWGQYQVIPSQKAKVQVSTPRVIGV